VTNIVQITNIINNVQNINNINTQNNNNIATAIADNNNIVNNNINNVNIITPPPLYIQPTPPLLPVVTLPGKVVTPPTKTLPYTSGPSNCHSLNYNGNCPTITAPPELTCKINRRCMYSVE
jgi:hypothetical protein